MNRHWLLITAIAWGLASPTSVSLAEESDRVRSKAQTQAEGHLQPAADTTGVVREDAVTGKTRANGERAQRTNTKIIPGRGFGDRLHSSQNTIQKEREAYRSGHDEKTSRLRDAKSSIGNNKDIIRKERSNPDLNREIVRKMQSKTETPE